ncbi:MAG: zinc ribbon-containing protein [Actinobacteria bacterium]|nr:zinc ribbon-containing protein [Actinomycetota bacterium]
MPGSGEKPGAGTYACAHDGQRVILESDDDMLMDCPSCGGSEYLLVERKSLVETTDAPPRLVAVLGYKDLSARSADDELELDASA